jgi:hypothetical protein
MANPETATMPELNKTQPWKAVWPATDSGNTDNKQTKVSYQAHAAGAQQFGYTDGDKKTGEVNEK